MLKTELTHQITMREEEKDQYLQKKKQKKDLIIERQEGW